MANEGLNNTIGSITSPAQSLISTVRDSLFSIMSALNVGGFDKTYTGAGVQGSLGKTVTTGASVSSISDLSDPFAGLYPRTYNIGSMTPSANVLIKKKMFTTLAYDNDPRFMDYSERAFIRTSKALFQLKAFQIATYEALTKFEQVLKQDHLLHIPLVLSILQNANAFDAITNDEFSVMQSSLLQIVQRDLSGEDTNFTTWFINQFDLDLANIGRGVGVIELTNFSRIETSGKMDDSGGNASVDFEDPYHIMMISNDDIESAIRGAMFDSFTTTLLPTIASSDIRGLADNLQEQVNSGNPIIQAQASAALNTVQEKAFDVLRPQFLSPEIISFVRKRMRKFYLGKAIIQPTDGLHIFMKSDAIYENDEDPTGLPLGLDRFGIDEEILKQEMFAVTKDKNFDINLYKILRDKNAFSGASVFAGVVTNVVDNLNDGFFTLNINARNNLWYLEQSFVNVQPALDQSQGVLHDPLTPFDFQFDSFGNIKATDNNGNVGFKLSQDNIDLLNQINIVHESGHLRGSAVTTDNIVGGVAPGTTIKQTEHFPGMLYKWKEGIASVSATINTSDPTGLFANSSRQVLDNAYGLAITSTPFDNMDVANVVSLLVTGLPYNITNFINDSLTSIVSNNLSNKSSSDSTSYFSNFFNIVQRQNKVLGNFKPLLNGNSVNVDTIKQLAYKKISFNQIDTKLGELESQILGAQQRLNDLPLSISGGDSDLLIKTRQGLESEIGALRVEQDILIQQFKQVSSDIDRISNNQDSLGFSTDPEQRESQITNYQFQQLYVASRRIEDVRYNRDINYFIVGTEYDADTDIQAFQANLRNGFKYFDNRYDSAITKAREAAKVIDFEFFADFSGNIRFRPPQYNKVPLSVYFELFRRKGQQGVDLLPDFIKDLFVNNISAVRENIVELNWKMLIELGKSGNDALINAMKASVPSSQGSTQSKGIVEFLGYTGGSVVSDGDVINQLVEFNSSDQIGIDRSVPPSSVTTNNILTLEILNNIATQLEKRFGGTRLTISEEDVIKVDDNSAVTKRKELFKNLRNLSSQRNALIKSYLSQLNNLGVNASDISNRSDAEAAFAGAILAKQDKLSQEILQIVTTGGLQGFARPTISSEFINLIEDDTRNFIGRGSGRRFIIRDDSIKSCRIEESQPEFCRITIQGQKNFISGDNIIEGRWLWAGAVDYDLWRMYGFKTRDDMKVPFLSDPETQLKPYAVFQLLKERQKVMKGSVSIIGNEYYQLGDVIYLADRDMLFYVTGVSHTFGEGDDFSTTLTLEYGRPPGEYIPTPLDVIGKVLLKQNTSSTTLTKRQLNPDTFYYPLRPTPVLYLNSIKNGENNNLEKMLRTDSNQGRLINALMNANIALQRPNTVLIVSGFKTGSQNDDDVQARIDVVAEWFKTPQIISSGIEGKTVIQFTEYNAIPASKIETKILDSTLKNQDSDKKSDPDPNDVVASDQTIINTINDSNVELGIKNACQEVFALIRDRNNVVDEMPFIIQIGIFFKEQK